jgi:SAM-dependent methyltransferase
MGLANIRAIQSRKPQSTEEIEARKNRYRTAINSQYKKEAFTGSDIEFFRSLNREISIGLVPPDNLDRATRLLVETNRLNFNPGKFEDYDQGLEYIHECLKTGAQIYAIATSEGEHSLGLTAALIINIDKEAATITDGSFSCGIIGRDFEQKSLIALIEILKKRHVSDLFLHLTKTATNIRVQNILEELGFMVISTDDIDDGLMLKFHLNISGYDTNQYDWIRLSDDPPSFDYVGHPYVIEFFESHVKPLMAENSKVINLGSARGEVLGFLQEQVKQDFEKFIQECNIEYSKVDLHYYQEEDNFVGNAEDLEGIIETASQDIVIAVELLEHTQRPWKVINEMIRVCKLGGHIFISVPSFNYPKHEYPIDLWRIGPETLRGFFDNDAFEIIEMQMEGMEGQPRRSIILVQKIKESEGSIEFPQGILDEARNITVYD